MVDEVEDYRANAPTPTLFSMTKELRSLSWDGKTANPARIFAVWQKFCWETVHPPFGLMLSMMTEKQPTFMKVARHCCTNWVRAPTLVCCQSLDAPFPSAEYTMGPRAMPSQVPSLPTSPSLEQQRLAWEFFDTFDKPFVCAFADDDPVTKGGDAIFLQRVPGTKGQPHTTIKGAGHFLQETRPKEVSQVIIDVVARSAS